MSRYLLILLFALLPFLTGASCRKNNPKGTAVEVTSPEQKIQVISIEPDTLKAGYSNVAAEVQGVGFEPGASVFFDGKKVLNPDFKDENTILIMMPSLAAGSHHVRVENKDGTAHTLRGAFLVEAAASSLAQECRNTTLYFNLDKAKINDDSLAKLERRNRCFKNTNFRYRIEGHCDERGSTSYNLALGLRRAETVQRHLQASFGIAPSRVEAISYGEERPLDASNNEDAWAKNRRAIIVVVD